MLIKTLFPIPRQKLYLACSGGSDSMAVFAYLLKGNHDFEVLNYHHGTEFGGKARNFVEEVCQKFDIPFHTNRELPKAKPKKTSPEEHWRNCRYEFFAQYDDLIVMAHNLDDCVESWIFSCLHGNPYLIPFQNKNIVRPFILSTKEGMKGFAEINRMTWVEDPSNKDNKYTRNYIRNILMENAQKVNANIHKTIYKKIVNCYNESGGVSEAEIKLRSC